MEELEEDDVTSLIGPVEDIDGALTLRIPLAAGLARGKLGISADMLVAVDNRNGKLNIFPQYGDEN